MRDSEREIVRIDALRAENERLRKYAERLSELQARLPEIITEAAHRLDGERRVSVCKPGQQIWVGWHDECPECGGQVRQTTAESADGSDGTE